MMMKPEPRQAGGDHTVSGTITAVDQRARGEVTAVALAVNGDFTTDLGSCELDKGGAYRIHYLPPATGALNLQVQLVAADGNVLGRSRLVRHAPPALELDLVIGRGGVVDPATPFRVRVAVTCPVPAAVAGLRVELFDRRIGGDQPLVEATTDAAGVCDLSFSRAALLRQGRDKPDLIAKVSACDQLLASSALLVDAEDGACLEVRLPESARPMLRSEAEALLDELQPLTGGVLKGLREDGERRDITLLARKSGWDARLIAMASAAERLSEQSAAAGHGLEPDWFYALFRAGLPADPATLYRSPVGEVAQIWNRALESQVIPAARRQQLDHARACFAALSAAQMLGPAPTVGLSPVRDLLRLSLDGADQQQRFAELQAQYGDDPAKFWKNVDEHFGEKAKELRVDSALAALTLNNAPLVKKLRVGEGGVIADTGELLARGLYAPAAWKELLTAAEVPKEITGANDEERRVRYAELMSATLRLSFPTAVLAAQVREGDALLRKADGTPADDKIRTEVADFLDTHRDDLFMGTQSVEQYIRHKDVKVQPDTLRELQRLQRVYQVTPGDDSMAVLLREGVDSAYAIVSYGRERFVEQFGGKFADAADAGLIYAKAEQVHAAVLNLTVAYVSAKNAPGIGVHSPARIINPAPNVPNPNATDVLAYAALESLFGEMDYCECKHCRSVLSPAAYLVNLLQFLDPPGHPDPTPLKVLLERRPDIQHLPLTCENTNTPLPQIDLVNETLEYFVAADSPVAAPQVSQSLGGFTGHDTAPGVTSADLLASPSFVRDAAYKILEGASFPVLLPLHQPLESLRRHFRRFETPHPRVMEALRTSDAVERAGTLAQPAYGWRDVFLEELPISRAEYALLTDSTRPFWELFGEASGTAEAALLPQLAKAKRFARRIGVGYEELVRVLGTQFVNPNAALIPKLLRLGVPFITLKRLKDAAITDAQFLAAITPQLNANEYGGTIAAWVKDAANYSRIMGILTLVDPTAAPDDADLCNFDNLELRYSLPDNGANAARGIEYLKLLRFIRLWRRLGWPIELVDQAITSLYPTDQLPAQPVEADNRTRLDAGFRVLLLRLGILQRVLAELELDAKRDLPGLLACFAPMTTAGSTSLYRQLFTGTEFLRQHPQFADDGYGNFLDDPAARLLAEREALRGAMQLTDEEFAKIVTVFDANTVLDIPNVTYVYRRGWLARKLRISVAELLALMTESGIDPFGQPAVGATADTAVPAMLRLLRLVTDLRDSELKPGPATYLVWNRDLSGNSAPAPEAIASFAITLRRDLVGVTAGMNVVQDPEGTVARERMALVYGAETTETFFGLLEGTFVTQVAYAHTAATLAPALLAIAPERLAYDDLRKQLSFKGVTTTAQQTALKAGQPAAFQNAVDALFAANQRVVVPFFAAFPELRLAFDNYLVSTAPLEQRRMDMLATFLPVFIRSRSRQAALQAVSIAVRSNVDFASALLERKTLGVFPLHAVGDPLRPGLDDLVALGTPGLAARFYFRATATGNVDATSAVDSDLAYSPVDHALPANPAAAAAPVSGIWTGLLEAPETGFYNLRVEADGGATVTLRLGGAVVAMANNGNQWSNNAPVEFTAAQLVPIEITVENTRTMIARWQTAARSWEVIPPRFLFAQAPLDALTTHYVRTLKAASMQAALKLSVAEIAHLASVTETRINNQGWLNALVVSGATPLAQRRPLFNALSALLNYALLKKAFQPEEDQLLEAVRDPTAAGPSGINRLVSVTRWNDTSLTDLLARLGLTRAQLAQPANLRRVADGFALLNKLGISAAALIAATTNQPDATMVRNLQSALRARYSEADWLNVLQPINDELRTLQRDALVAFILQRMSLTAQTRHIDTPDRLFEYFLMDVQMEPCMQTSRVRHALNAVQLFVDRSLMGLEARVSPASIDGEQWKWMNRYRVWEANRKVFLYPENWLEPELRDDQSQIFREVMGELLQGDVTEERAQVALLGYLAKLDEVAKLEPCGLWHEAGAPGTADDITHVVARTPGAGRKFYYRKRENGSWTPWEQVKLDIEDAPVTPVIWKGRLFLFWLRVLQGPIEVQTTDDTVPANAPNLAGTNAVALRNQARTSSSRDSWVRTTAVLCWSERFNNAWQGVKTSDVKAPMVIQTGRAEWFDRRALHLMADEHEGSLIITVGNRGTGPISNHGHFRLYNTHSEAVPADPYIFLPRFGEPQRLFTPGTNSVLAQHHYQYRPYSTVPPSQPAFDVALLADKLIGRPRLVPPTNLTPDPWSDPFFLTNSRHSFFATTIRYDTPILFGAPWLFGNYTLVSTVSVISNIVNPHDSSRYAAARNKPMPDVSRPIDSDLTSGDFLRRTLESSEPWRYGDTHVEATGAVYVATPR